MREVNRWEVFAQVLEGVEAVHEAGYVHRDLKPGNILLKTVDGKIEPRIADFGVSKEVGAKVHGVGGTPTYMPPDEVLKKGVERDLSNKVDSWALGIIALQEVAHVPVPWLEHMDMGLYRIALKDALNGNTQALENMKDNLLDSIDFNSIKNKKVREAVEGLLKLDPDERMSVSDARKLIEQGIEEMKSQGKR